MKFSTAFITVLAGVAMAFPEPAVHQPAEQLKASTFVSGFADTILDVVMMIH